MFYRKSTSILLALLCVSIGDFSLASVREEKPQIENISSTSEKSDLSVLSGIDLVTGNTQTFDLSKAKTMTALVFFSIRCPCSASHQPTVNQLAKEFEKEGIQFIGIHSNANEDFGSSRTFFQNSGLTIPVLQDTGAKIAIRFGALKTPHAFVVDRNLNILFQGGIDNSKLTDNATEHYLRDYLNEALLAFRSGKTPTVKSVRVLGCEIKRP
jgi:peroxiredoxin